MHKDIDITAIREKSGWFLYEMPGLIHEMVIFQKNCTELVVGKRSLSRLKQPWLRNFTVAATAGINFNFGKALNII